MALAILARLAGAWVLDSFCCRYVVALPYIGKITEVFPLTASGNKMAAKMMASGEILPPLVIWRLNLKIISDKKTCNEITTVPWLPHHLTVTTTVTTTAAVTLKLSPFQNPAPLPSPNHHLFWNLYRTVLKFNPIWSDGQRDRQTF